MYTAPIDSSKTNYFYIIIDGGHFGGHLGLSYFMDNLYIIMYILISFNINILMVFIK